MRLKIRCDCTGDPPGELITTATARQLRQAEGLLDRARHRRHGQPRPQRRRHADGPDEAQHRNDRGCD